MPLIRRWNSTAPSLAEICENIRDFVFWSTTIEYRLRRFASYGPLCGDRSITVDPTHQSGERKRLVKALLAQAETSRHLWCLFTRILIFFAHGVYGRGASGPPTRS